MLVIHSYVHVNRTSTNISALFTLHHHFLTNYHSPCLKTSFRSSIWRLPLFLSCILTYCEALHLRLIPPKYIPVLTLPWQNTLISSSALLVAISLKFASWLLCWFSSLTATISYLTPLVSQLVCILEALALPVVVTDIWAANWPFVRHLHFWFPPYQARSRIRH